MYLLNLLIVYPLIRFLSILPMRVLYLLSDFIFFLLYYIIGYRKDVVYGNLKLAFPKKSHKELKSIEKRFFNHLTDFFVESIKTFSISEKEIRKRMTYKNIEELEKVVKTGKSIVLVGPHQANWEWLIGLPLHIDGIICNAAYTRVKNKMLENLIKSSRSKFGGVMHRTQDTIRSIHNNHQLKKQSLYCLASDQSPPVQKTHYWAEFMGIKVPIHTGAEMLAKKYDMAYMCWTSRKVKRGHYEIEFKTVAIDSKAHKDYELTDEFLKIVHRDINESPETYLWSHKRFKHMDKVPEEWK